MPYELSKRFTFVYFHPHAGMQTDFSLPIPSLLSPLLKLSSLAELQDATSHLLALKAGPARANQQQSALAFMQRPWPCVMLLARLLSRDQSPLMQAPI